MKKEETVIGLPMSGVTLFEAIGMSQKPYEQKMADAHIACQRILPREVDEMMIDFQAACCRGKLREDVFPYIEDILRLAGLDKLPDFQKSEDLLRYVFAGAVVLVGRGLSDYEDFVASWKWWNSDEAHKLHRKLRVVS